MNTTTTPTNKIKINGDSTSKEIELPYYCKSVQLYLKIISDDLTIAVKTYSFSTLIEISTDGRHDFTVCDNSEESTEEEFNEAFQTALSKIQNIQL